MATAAEATAADATTAEAIAADATTADATADGTRPSGQRRTLGELGEELVARYFTERGDQVLDRNWHCRQGEIDLVVQDSDGVLIAVEVKTRRGLGFGEPIEAVTEQKVKRLRRLLGAWRQDHPEVAGRDLRLDVVGVLVQRGQQVRLRHITGVG